MHRQYLTAVCVAFMGATLFLALLELALHIHTRRPHPTPRQTTSFNLWHFPVCCEMNMDCGGRGDNRKVWESRRFLFSWSSPANGLSLVLIWVNSSVTNALAHLMNLSIKWKSQCPFTALTCYSPKTTGTFWPERLSLECKEVLLELWRGRIALSRSQSSMQLQYLARMRCAIVPYQAPHYQWWKTASIKWKQVIFPIHKKESWNTVTVISQGTEPYFTKKKKKKKHC